jgi:hypothetical protein
LQTWAERLPRGAVAVAVAASLVLAADLGEVSQVHAEKVRCGGDPAPPTSRLDVTLRLLSSRVRRGDDVAGEAVVINRTRSSVVLRRADGVLLAPGTRRVETWTRKASFAPVALTPGSFARIGFVVHLAACPHGGGRLVPGFHEVSLLLVEAEPGGAVRRTRSGSLTTVLAP